MADKGAAILLLHTGSPNRKLVSFVYLVTYSAVTMEGVFRGLDQCSEEEKLQRLSKLKLRYFTPREVANLMGFPSSFSFPKQIPTKQQYKVLGNSLNVVVVARLLQLLVS